MGTPPAGRPLSLFAAKEEDDAEEEVSPALHRSRSRSGSAPAQDASPVRVEPSITGPANMVQPHRVEHFLNSGHHVAPMNGPLGSSANIPWWTASQPSIGGAAPGAPISAAAKAVAGLLAAKGSSGNTAATGSDTGLAGIGSLTNTNVTRVGSNTLSQDAQEDEHVKAETPKPDSTGGEGDGYPDGDALPPSLSCKSAVQTQTATAAAAAAARRAVGSGRKTGTPTATAALTPAKRKAESSLPSTASLDKSGMDMGNSSGDEGAEGEEDDGNGERKTQRRLEQNREAARKSRMRRKAYVQKLEEEVKLLKSQQSAAPLPGAPSVSSAPGPVPYTGPTSRAPYSADVGGIPFTATMVSTSTFTGVGPPGPSVSGFDSRPVSEGTPSAARLPTQATADPEGLLHQNAEVLKAFEKWRAEHFQTALNIRYHLEGVVPSQFGGLPASGGPVPAAASGREGEEALGHLVEEARAQIWTLFAMKKAVIYSESVLLILSLEHLLPSERIYAWLGTLRASDACQGLLSKMEETLAAPQVGKIQALKEQLLNEEAMLLKGYNQAVRELREKAREAPLKEDNLACVESWNTPEVLGKLETIRVVLVRADQVWERFLEETEKCLSLQQYAVAVIAMMEMSAQLRNLHLPWLRSKGGVVPAAAS